MVIFMIDAYGKRLTAYGLTQTGSKCGNFSVKHAQPLHELVALREIDRAPTGKEKHDVCVLISTAPRNVQKVFEVTVGTTSAAFRDIVGDTERRATKLLGISPLPSPLEFLGDLIKLVANCARLPPNLQIFKSEPRHIFDPFV